MHYVLDAGFFTQSRLYYPNTFPSFWEKLDELVVSRDISSVSEVKKEIKNYGGEQEHMLEWIEQNKDIFTKPSEEEQEEVRRIFYEVPIFRNLINKKNILKGDPTADPFVIAKAMIIEGGRVVTSEKPEKKDKKGNIQGPPKIPGVCSHFEIPCITPQQFMEEQKWTF